MSDANQLLIVQAIVGCGFANMNHTVCQLFGVMQMGFALMFSGIRVFI